jgi:hypothetical protein
MDGPDSTRREFLKALGAAAAAADLPSGARGAEAPGVPSPAFTRSGREIWVALRGEDRIAVVDVERALRQVGGTEAGAVVAAFDVSEPLAPRFVAQIPLGALSLPSGELRNRRGGALVYVRPGHRAAGG